ncbi:MAG: hypothetical protein GXP25_16400 [Planctomycetes bacterium]|nr:hypothetical protein [Planctomycetota bacterium]
MSGFDPKKYEKKIAESRERLAIARRFEEPDRVPILISTAGSYYSRLFGYNIRDYYTDPDVKIEVQLKGLEWAYETLDDDRTSYSITYDLGPIGEAMYWDMPIEYPDDTSPRAVEILHDPADIETLPVPDPETHPAVKKLDKEFAEFKENVEKRGIDLPVGGGQIGIHPPISCACALMGADKVYELMAVDKAMAAKLFDKCFEAFCKLRDFYLKRSGGKSTSIGLADDNSAFISNAMYRDQIFKYNKAIYDKYGPAGRSFHADGPNDHHFEMYANDMKLTSMDMGGFSKIENAKKYLGGKVFFSGGLNCKDLYYDFETAKPAVEHAVRIGAPGGGYALAIGGETYPGVNPDTLVRSVAYAKEIGTYPIQL